MPNSLVLLRGVVALVLCAAVVSACHAAQNAGQEVKDGTAEPAMNTPDEAEAAFKAAEDELGEMLVTRGIDGAPPPPAPAPSPPDMAGNRPVEQTAEPSPAPLQYSRTDRCTRACRALASMQRAADRLCELTGDDDARCKGVRERVENARTRVRGACPSCQA